MAIVYKRNAEAAEAVAEEVRACGQRALTIAADLQSLSILAQQPKRLADHEYQWTSGWHEKGAKTDGLIRWQTDIPGSWEDLILQGPHFSVAVPLNKQPNEGCWARIDKDCRSAVVIG